MKHSFRSVSMVVLLGVLAACGDDDPVAVTGDPLTEAEVGALAEVVAGTLFSTFESREGLPAAAPAAAPAAVSGTLSVTAPVECEFGGTVAVSGSVDYDLDTETGAGTLDFSVQQDHDECVVESEDGVRFTLNGSPNISGDFLITLDAEQNLSLDGGYSGGVAWETGDRSGTCTLDVDFSLAGNLAAETGSASVSGTVCGVSFTHELTLT